MIELEEFIKIFNLEIVQKGEENVTISVNDINRPGLQLAGYYNYFDPKKVQILGKSEISYLENMDQLVRKKKIKKYIKAGIDFVLITRNLEYPQEFFLQENSKKIWLLRTKEETTPLIHKTIMFLAERFSNEIAMHGVLMDIYGLGILIIGESGIGKSETALELIKRGHRLVSDDQVIIKNIEGRLVGSAPKITQGMMEVRGIGIVDISALFGISSVMYKKTIKLVVGLKSYSQLDDIDRLGIDPSYIDILGEKIQKIDIPVSTGRNLAVLVEAAAVNYRHNLVSSMSPIETIRKRTIEENQNK